MPYLTERRSSSPEAERRLRVLTGLAAVGFSVLLFRLFQLQIFRGAEMHRLAEMNRTQIIPLAAPRGFVMDRRGEVLLDNVPHFSLFYTHPSVSVQTERDMDAKLTRLFPGQEAALKRKLAEARRNGKMTRIVSGVPRGTALALIEKRLTLPGVAVLVEPRRRSRYGAFASHVLGYVDEISPVELERRQGQGFKLGQLIGRTGVERSYDGYLRGEDGGLQFEMDAGGRHVHVLRRIPSQPGMDLYLTIDRRLQEVVEQGLETSPSGKGAAVAMDPRSGAVLALASYPDFDPSGNMGVYLRDRSLPLFSRALQGTYPPGSIFKPMTAAAALQEANWDIRRTYLCTGIFHLGSREFACWSVHGVKDFMGALAWSCNVYMYNIGLRIGPDPIERMAKAFGLGQKTGIDLPSESSGLIPGRDWKKRMQKAAWFDGDTVNFSIGQGAVSITPLQAAGMLSAVANGGTLWHPYVLDRVVDAQGETVYQHQRQARRRIELSPYVWKTVHRAMQGVVTTGTAHGIYRPDLVLGGKTGTAQNPHGKDHAWFAAYAGKPGEEPSLAVIVFVENGGRGSVAAGPIARAVINAAFPPPAPVPAPGVTPGPAAAPTGAPRPAAPPLHTGASAPEPRA